VYDVNQDGRNDLMYGAGHHYGIFWLENRAGACQDHLIDNSWSQGHALTLADMDKDGRLDIVIGKRDLAHDIDPGAYEPLGTYWYRSEDADRFINMSSTMEARQGAACNSLPPRPAKIRVGCIAWFGRPLPLSFL